MPAIMFHHFHGEGHPEQQGSLSGDDLRRIIETRQPVSAHTWTPADAQEVLTFDDALLCQKDVAVPILKEYGLTAFFFVYTAPLVGVVSRLELYRRVRTTMFPTVDAFYDAFGWVQPARGLLCRAGRGTCRRPRGWAGRVCLPSVPLLRRATA